MDCIIRTVCCGVFCLLLSAANLFGQNALVQRLASLALPSIVRVSATDAEGKASSGSGLLITEDGFFICTDNHLLQSSSQTVRLANGKDDLKVRLIVRKAGSRLTLMKIEKSGLKGLPHGKFVTISEPPSGQEYLVLGFYDEKEGTKWALGKTLGMFRPFDALGADVSGIYQFEAIKLSAQFNGACSGGPILTAQGQLLGIAAYSVGQKDDKPIAVCYGIPAKTIVAFLAAVTDPKAIKAHKSEVKSLKTLVDAFSEKLDTVQKIAFRKETTLELEKLLAAESRYEEQITVLKQAEIDKRVAKMSRSEKAIHRKHPDWHPDVVEWVASRTLKKGMTKDMVSEMYGSPKMNKVKTINGQRCTVWSYHNRASFGRITKAREILFDPQGRVCDWVHHRGNLYIK